MANIVFFAGNAKSKQAAYFVENLFDKNPSQETVCIFSDDEPEWEETLMSKPCLKIGPESFVKHLHQ